MRNLRLVIALLLVAFMAPMAQGQTEDDIRKAMSAALKFFGSTMGAGLYHSADVHGPLGFCLGVNGAIVAVPDEFKVIPVINDDKITLGYLHANLGLGGNLEVTGRVLFFALPGELNSVPTPGASDGNGKLFSVGVKYGLLQMPLMPKLALQANGHFVTLPSEFDFGKVRGASVKLIASHSFAIFGVYVGGGIDFSQAKIDDDFLILPGESFDETGFLYSVGAQANVLPFVTVNAGVNFGEYNSYDLGVDIGIR